MITFLLLFVSQVYAGNITNLSAPVIGDDKSTYSTKITNSFSAIDEHTHISGKGLPIPAGGLSTVSPPVTTNTIAANAVTTAKIADASITAAKLAVDLLLPPGVVTSYVGTSAPAGWLLCNGATVSRTTYAALFAIIGTTHGSGDGSTTFHLPDYRGRFLRGVDGTAARDPDDAARTAMNSGGNTGDAVGSIQDNATKKNGLAISDQGHSHGSRYSNGSDQGVSVNDLAVYPVSSALSRSTIGDGNRAVGGAGDTWPPSYNIQNALTGTSLTTGDNETRPLNAYVNYIVKY